jgi:phenylpropionate dioxygenase-like ring-hydroxylating dioxygenase large terminal subunit
VRREDGSVGAMSAVCRHRGHTVTCTPNKRLRCALHTWTYDLDGRLIGAPHMGDAAAIRELRATTTLPPVRLELWHGFIFVNLDDDAPPLAPSLAKVEPFLVGYDKADLTCMPPKLADTPLPWNWKVHVENFTDAYHTEYVHAGTHDFAPSVHPEGNVTFTPMETGDNAIVRTVPMIRPDGGLMEDGWGEPAAFPPIASLSPAQRKRATFVMIPPSMTLMITPNNIAYTLIAPTGAEATFASSDRVTAGGWLLPRSTMALPNFAERVKRAQTGASKIWAQDVPVNLAMQRGKHSRYLPAGCYSPLETTLSQFNGWLLAAYERAAAR